MKVPGRGATLRAMRAMGCASIVAALVSVGLAAAPPASGATEWSAVDDFSTTINSETSTWSYRFKGDLVRDGSYSPLSTFGFPPVDLWNPDTPYWFDSLHVPGVGVNATGAPITRDSGFSFDWPTGTIWMHPNLGGLVVVSWLSPANMTVDIAFSFSDMDPNVLAGTTGINWYVDRNSTGLLSGSLAEGGATGIVNLNGVSVSAGDRINFVVAPAGDVRFDSTQFTAMITSAGPLTVAIDIKPGAFPNAINPRARGVIPVAVLTTDAFDAGTVDPTTLRFGPGGAAPVHWALEDVDGDADPDLIVHFPTQDSGIACGDSSATLTGQTIDGQEITGSDSIKTAGCK